MDEINQKLDAFLDSHIQDILGDSNLQHLTPQQKEEYAEKLRVHFSRLALDTLLNRLDETALEEIHKVKEDPEELEKKLEEYASTVPMLAQDIEERIEREVEAIKQGLKLS